MCSAIDHRERLWDLLERQHSGTRSVRPVECDDGAPIDLRLAILKGAEKRGTAYFRHQRFTTEQHNAGGSLPRVREEIGRAHV